MLPVIPGLNGRPLSDIAKNIESLLKLPTCKRGLVPWKFNSLANKKAQGLCSLDIIKSTKTSSISNERLALCLVYHHSILKTNLKLPVLLKSSSRTTKLWIFFVDVGSASPKESHFGRSFHTSSVMCFETEVWQVYCWLLQEHLL